MIALTNQVLLRVTVNDLVELLAVIWSVHVSRLGHKKQQMEAH